MNPTEIEFAVKGLVSEPYNPESFPYNLVAIYNAPKATVTKLRAGTTNVAAMPGDLLWKKHLFFRHINNGEDVAAVGDALVADPLTAKHKPRFVFVTNGERVHIRDLKLDSTCNAEYSEVVEWPSFLLPLAGFEPRAEISEHPADIKAARRLKKLYDAVLAANRTWTAGHHAHELNLFMTRVLFCLYAEDTGIFDTPQIFTKTVTQHTKEDGSDVAELLDRLFRIMNVAHPRPSETPSVEAAFPYVNGSLFEATVEVPAFNRTARRLLLECGELDWTSISPDIFGSMIQTIATPGAREEIGMHYTSLPNIRNVLKPLLFDDLNQAFEKAKDSVQKLEALLVRLAHIRIFDPACGSGNFLIIAYKDLRELEMRILTRIGELAPNNPLRLSGIALENFFGRDIIDFACETAKLSLWIAEYQMNCAFKELFGTARPPLPLGRISTVDRDNSLRADWLKICPKDDSFETYICGNPPYVGYQSRTAEQKEDLKIAIASYTPHLQSMDYICGWFILAAAYARETGARYAFVSTNSVCQGEQVGMLWPVMFKLGAYIDFAYTSFKWSNNAAHNAGVSCVIVGLSPTKPPAGRLITGDHEQRVAAIGPYLIPDASRLVVTPRRQAGPEVPPMVLGSNPTDGGHLIMSPAEANALLSKYPESRKLVRKYTGSNEVINSIERYCLWIADDEVELAKTIPPIADRIESVAAMRRASPSQEIRDSAVIPHRFRRRPAEASPALVVPHVFSERRAYLTVGLIGAETIVNNTAYAIYNPPAFLFALISSRLHLLWQITVGGKLENRLRYSNTLTYNTFPVPMLSPEQKRVLGERSRDILGARVAGKPLAWLYNPETMPAALQAVHRENDEYIEEHVYGRKFRDDTHRVEHLFSMYAAMIAREDAPLLATAGSSPTKKES